MTNSKENLIPKFASTFQPIIDQEGYLVNQDDLSCREVVGTALAILRTSKDHDKTKKDDKEILDTSLEISSSGSRMIFLIGPDSMID